MENFFFCAFFVWVSQVLTKKKKDKRCPENVNMQTLSLSMIPWQAHLWQTQKTPVLGRTPRLPARPWLWPKGEEKTPRVFGMKQTNSSENGRQKICFRIVASNASCKSISPNKQVKYIYISQMEETILVLLRGNLTSFTPFSIIWGDESSPPACKK